MSQFLKIKLESNILDAIANGTTEGLKLAVNVGGNVIGFCCSNSYA